MIITIFGSTGMVGKHLVNQALHMGHSVRAFGRNVFTAGFPESENLHLYQGALFDEKQVLEAVSGADAVLSALGGSFDGKDKSRSLGMKNIVEQMQKAAVNRIILVGGMGSLDGPNNKPIFEKEGFPAQFLPVSHEHYEAYKHVKASNLNWTVACVPDIIEAEVTGVFHTSANTVPEPNNNKINAGDLAFFMLQELEKNNFSRSRVGISN